VLETAQRPSSHSKHLKQVTGWLRTEFGDQIDTDLIHQVAAEEVAHFQKARVQEFVATISWRVARARLEDLLVERSLESS
jgi:hypothetical protein